MTVYQWELEICLDTKKDYDAREIIAKLERFVKVALNGELPYIDVRMTGVSE